MLPRWRGHGQRDRTRRGLRRGRCRHGFRKAMTSLDDYRKVKAAVGVPGARQPHRVRQHAVLHHRRAARCRRVDIALYCCGALPRDEQDPRSAFTRRSAATARRNVIPMTPWADPIAGLYDFLGYHATRTSSTSCLRRRSGQGPGMSRADPPRRSSRRNPLLSGGSRQHRAAAVGRTGDHRPAAATTSRPPPASSRKSPTCWCTASRRTAPTGQLQGEAEGAARHPRRSQGGAGGIAAIRAPDGT